MAFYLGSFTSGLFEGANQMLGMQEGLHRLKDWDTHDKASEAAAREAADAMANAGKPQEYKPIDVRVDQRPAVAPGGGEPGAAGGGRKDDIPPPKTKAAPAPATMPSTLPQIDVSGIPAIPGDPNAKPNVAPGQSWWTRPVSELVPDWMKPQPGQNEPGNFPPSPAAQPGQAAIAPPQSPYPPTSAPTGQPTQVPPIDPNKPQIEQLRAMTMPQLQTLLSNPGNMNRTLIRQALDEKRQAAIPAEPPDTNFPPTPVTQLSPQQAPAPPATAAAPPPAPPASPGSGTMGASNQPPGAGGGVPAQTAGLVVPPGVTPPPGVAVPPQQQVAAAAAPPPVPPSEAAPTGNMLTRALSAINPISTAQAAEVPPKPQAALPPASSRTDMTVTPQGPEDRETRAQPPPPAPGGLGAAKLGQPDSVAVPAAIPPKGEVPAKVAESDPTAKPSPAQPAGPAVSTPSITVAPDQQGPTQRSETPPKVTQPPLDLSAWETVKQQRSPEVVAEIERIASKWGVSPERIAAHWKMESGLRGSSENGKAGEIGVMQIMPGTRDLVDPHHKLDPTNFWDNIELSAKIIARCDAEFGRDTVASAAAYNAGPGGANRMPSGNGPASTYTYVQRMFHGQINNDMYATGSRSGTGGGGSGEGGGVRLMEAGVQGGPDGFISMVAQTGAPNATLTDKWHSANYAIIKDAYRLGGAEGAQHAMDFITQMSHMGSNNALMSAYRAMSAGDTTTAAQQLARAHTFFPDGAIGQFGVDGKGNLWAQRVSEQYPTVKLGQPFQVTREGIEQMLVQTHDPNKYVAMLSQMRANNQKVALEAARQKWYEGADQRAETRADAAIAGRAIGGSGTTPGQLADDRARETAINTSVDKAFHVDPSKVADEKDLPKLRVEGAVGSLAMRDLMTNSKMPAATAEHYGRGINSGDYEMRKTEDGRVGLYRKGAPAGGSPDALISPETAAAITRTAPNVRIVAPSAPAKPQAKPG
jgi:hypothetical protein